MLKPTLDPRTGLFRVRPYYDGERLLVSLGTRDKGEAEILSAEIGKRIWTLENGITELPQNADPIEFIKSGTIKTRSERKTLSQLIEAYEEATPEGAKSRATRVTEKIHFKHLTRLMGEETTLSQLNRQKIQRYLNSRLKESSGGNLSQPPPSGKSL